MAMTGKGWAIMGLLAIGVLYGAKKGYDKLNPKKAKNVEVKTKATGLPPLAYDKNANAPFHALPSYGSPADVQTPAIRGHVMEWYAQLGMMNAVGGKQTAQGSICEELKVNLQLDVQNSCSKQAEDLYAFADELHAGNPQPTKGAHFTVWMGDAGPAYLAGLNARLKKDFGEEYRAEVVTFTGASAGEDKWLLKKKYATNAKGSLTCTVIRDGDWNICVMKSQLMGWPINFTDGTYDPDKVNFVAAPNDDYLEAAKFYATGQKVTLKLVRNGKYTGKDTSIACSGVSTWFPGDLNAVQQKGGLVVAGSTKDFGSQMPAAVIMIKKWADDNHELVENFIAAIGMGGDQVKSHQEALEFGAKVGKDVFASTMEEGDIVKAYATYDVTDEDGNVVNIGGSRVFNLADAAAFAGISGGQDKYKIVYNTFGNVDVEAYPEIVPSFPPYEEATDWAFLRAAFNKYKAKAGNTSSVDFKSATRTNEVVGDAAYSIEYNTGSAVIKPVSYPTLDKVLAQLNIADNSFVDISGFTDNTGNDQQNIPLSKQRAEAVKQYLLQKDGSLADRLRTNGFGSANPVADNATEAGKAKNRRVEIKLSRTR